MIKKQFCDTAKNQECDIQDYGYNLPRHKEDINNIMSDKQWENGKQSLDP